MSKFEKFKRKPGEPSLADELIAERRREACAEHTRLWADEFFEEDEPVEKIRSAFADGEQATTEKP